MTKNELKKLKKDELIKLIERTMSFAERMSESWERDSLAVDDIYLRTYYKACRDTYEVILKNMDTHYRYITESKKGGF